jgi:hypothetical protein
MCTNYLIVSSRPMATHDRKLFLQAGRSLVLGEVTLAQSYARADEASKSAVR